MKRLFPLLGGLFLLAAFVYSGWRALGVRHAPDDGRIVIRIAHQLLQTGMRESFDEAAAEYSRLHPHVSIEQIAIPIRMWSQWLRTQLVGGTVPDITSLANTNEEITARHYLMLGEEIHAPNPYNAGTPLDGVPWRDTFTDGLSRMYALSPSSGELVGVNLQLNTIRVFYNLDLLRKVTGSADIPSDYRELRALGEQVATYNRAHGLNRVPIASCEPYLPYLAGLLAPSQTQKLARELSPFNTLGLSPMDQAGLMLEGRLSYAETPELRSSLALLRDVSTLLTPGFAALSRDDALFAFMQRHALAICAGSWDYAAFVADGSFEVGVGPVPLPAPDDPDYGRFIIGPASEADGHPEAFFGVTRYSRHPDVALDFLRFLSSYTVARRFTENTWRISAIAQVPPPSAASGLAPRVDGEVNGFYLLPFGFNEASIVFNRNRHLLLGARGDVDTFAREMDRQLPAAVARDVELQLNHMLRAIRRADTHIGLLASAPADTLTAQDAPRFFENQSQRQFEHTLHSPRRPSP